MLYPSIDEMMNKVDSKYSLVVGFPPCQLREGGVSELKHPKSHKFVGVALEEIYGDYVKIEKDRTKAFQYLNIMR